MKYICGYCDYETSNKSNYNKHLKSKYHKQISELQNKYICIYCKKTFAHQSSLSRHETQRCAKRNNTNNINNINNINNTELLNSFITFMNDCRQTNNELKEQLIEYNRGNPQINNQSTNNTVNTTYNISKLSIKNYLRQKHPNAPALEGLSDYAAIKYIETDEEDGDNNSIDLFIDILVYNQNNACLNKYLGDFIIQNYKKEDPTQQAMWSSDISRLTYIIKELLATKKSIWNHDYKGIKTKTYIIDPLLKYIKDYIDDYWMSTLDKYTSHKVENVNKYHKIYITLHQIKKDIENDVLGNYIIKYIAPYFYMDRGDTEFTD